ncbi:hypothetical protein L917_15715 [Phytophthora nicotianae]|uniref:CFA20 domain-containing protein n=4 Tax=Phytophthora nicotianae TaxID=4792 RepID=W2PQ46_PHYN3|nr:hypothetical protein PPTG_16097 [Phytophthora nicotianae INRA-310]ETI37536.1 hypothetical protein F443_16490 [Phytophthora nicotianae P1569]ETL31202.1 hypothetical protein L916_15917 [Phytophthora nicotianae]ETO66321.1 hypothetical protein F444_16454 [Phytophthora nicotianae P1976]KUF69656.1 hypothetical protein AM587_10014769 [Phytophthora nicotianae]ETL84463.1 hypothetical protein L917_15715 [Phytophthora nicotianae]
MKTASSLSTPPTLSSSLSGTPSFIRIGGGSFSPGDVYVDCILPKVLARDHQAETGDKKKSSLGSNTSFMSETVVLPLGEHPAILQAQEECRILMSGNDVCVIEDETVKEDVVQILGNDAELVFPVRNIFRYLVMFVKNMDLFLEFHIEVLDDTQKYRQFTVTNTRSLARVEDSRCQLPLAFGTHPGWRYLCMDLQDLTSQAFGTRHVTTTKVRVGGNCRLLRMFFQDERYADADLPAHLTFLG